MAKVRVPRIDLDLQASKRESVVSTVVDYFHSINGDAVQVCTYGTETSKSALITACRGLGQESEIGAYLSSLVEIDRGFPRTLKECYYGNPEKGIAPIPAFVEEMNANPDIWRVAQRIEGLISKRGRHAAGVICTNEPIENFTAVMRSPDGTLVTQLDLDDVSYCGGLKFDCLTTNALDRIRVALDLLIEYKYLENKGELKDNYDSYIHPDVISYDDGKMWDLLDEGKIINVFQFDTLQGEQTIKAIQPRSLLEMAQSNSLMRLMPENSSKTPVEEFVEYKKRPELLEQEIRRVSANERERKALSRHLIPLTGVCDSQESLMVLMMDKDLTNFTLTEANKARKLIAKKEINKIRDFKKFFYDKGKDNNVSKSVLDYIWDIQVSRQLGYSFSSMLATLCSNI